MYVVHGRYFSLSSRLIFGSLNFLFLSIKSIFHILYLFVGMIPWFPSHLNDLPNNVSTQLEWSPISLAEQKIMPKNHGTETKIVGNTLPWVLKNQRLRRFTLYRKFDFFLDMELCGLVPNSYIHVSVRGLYIPRILISCSQIDRPILGIYTAHRCGNWETKHYNSAVEITRLCIFISGYT